MGGAILTSYIGAVCGNRIFPELWHERGLFPSFQAPPSTVSLRTRASKHPIEQPPQPLDRSSLDLQNPERSSSLEAPRALTRHWSSRLSCPRATTRSRATTISEIVVPGIYSDQDHHQWIDRLQIYRCTRRRIFRSPERGLPSSDSRKLAPRPDSSEDDLPFGGGNASIGGRTRPHAPVRLRPPSPRASMQKHVRGTRGHAPGTRSCHVSPRCATASVLIATLKKLDLGFGQQPKRFPSTEVQGDWQVKNKKLDLGFGQPKRFPSTEVQGDWQAKKEDNLT
uniref:Uncharacterized protein n=1 Tax=Fagus sylvatica TaxID=28930 RepID=A0A2N9EFH3_FAGSY